MSNYVGVTENKNFQWRKGGRDETSRRLRKDLRVLNANWKEQYKLMFSNIYLHIYVYIKRKYLS